MDFIEEKEEKPYLGWDSCSSNEDYFYNPRSEVLWSRENNGTFQEHDFFQGLKKGFSDFTEGSTSSCSWHNDDFDMTASNKVKQSLEAIEDALYDQKQSPFISASVFEECCDWSNKFPYLRLKGKPITCAFDQTNSIQPVPLQNTKVLSDDVLTSLHVEGRKMAIHASDKYSKRAPVDGVPTLPEESSVCFDEILVSDGDYKDDNFEARDICLQLNDIDEETTRIESIKLLEDKIIEKIALEIWPKVLSVLEKVTIDPNIRSNEDFQLPPISSIEQDKISSRRPNTEGADLPRSDFSKLSGILSISPKVLQNKRDFKSMRDMEHSSRPSSEIHFSRRNQTISSHQNKKNTFKVSSSYSFLTTSKKGSVSNSKIPVKEKEQDFTSIVLPAVAEDSSVSPSFLRPFYQPDVKLFSRTRAATSPSKKTECFLPPIENKDHVPSNIKLTRNLFTFFGSQTKCDRNKIAPTNTPISRPNTSISKKSSKYTGSLQNKHYNEELSSNFLNGTGTKKLSQTNLEKQVTLFPIVTSLVPGKDRNTSAARKGLLNTFGGGRKR